jgi:hypothetical protein
MRQIWQVRHDGYVEMNDRCVQLVVPFLGIVRMLCRKIGKSYCDSRAINPLHSNAYKKGDKGACINYGHYRAGRFIHGRASTG